MSSHVTIEISAQALIVLVIYNIMAVNGALQTLYDLTIKMTWHVSIIIVSELSVKKNHSENNWKRQDLNPGLSNSFYFNMLPPSQTGDYILLSLQKYP